MKIYDTHTAPTPRRVRIFLAEKQVPMEYVQVDLQQGENLTPEMRSKNPIGKVPILELDDGTCVAESDAICRYFEVLYPDPPLMGQSALEQAQIAMWQRQVEQCLFNQVGLCFQHSTGYFKDRMTPFPEFGAACGENVKKYLNLLNKRLVEHDYIAGPQFTIADITALCAIDFARVVKIKIAERHTHLQDWYDRVSARSSAQA